MYHVVLNSVTDSQARGFALRLKLDGVSFVHDWVGIRTGKVGEPDTLYDWEFVTANESVYKCIMSLAAERGFQVADEPECAIQTHGQCGLHCR